MSRASIKRAMAASDLGKLMRLAAGRRNLYDVFADFCAMAAIAISNAVDLRQREAREAEYMRIIGRYEKAEQELFPQMMAALVMRMEAGPDDVLGKLFGELEIHNVDRGQFFTPYSVCQLMADLHVADGNMQQHIEAKGFVTVNEPTCGAGAMVIALAESMLKAGLNPQTQLHATCQDIDSRAVHMCYLHLALMHIPAVIILGNTLMLEQREVWYTPAHILGGWNRKLTRGTTWLTQPAPDEPVPVPEAQPEQSTLETPMPPPVADVQLPPRTALNPEDQIALF